MQRVRYSDDCVDSTPAYLHAPANSDRKSSLKSQPHNGEVRTVEDDDPEPAQAAAAATTQRFSRSRSHSPFSFRNFNRNCSYLSRRESAFLQELAATSPQQRNWRGILTALLVIFIMCSIIAIAVLVLTPCKFCFVKGYIHFGFRIR